jgi:uncharacterized membrane protein
MTMNGYLYRVCVLLGLLSLLTVPAFAGVMNQSGINGGLSSQSTPSETGSGDLNTTGTSVSTFVTVPQSIMDTGSELSTDNQGNDRTASTGSMSIQCDFPAQVLEAGETAEFMLNIYNTGAGSGPLKLRVEAFDEADQWDFRFKDGETQVSMVDIQQNSAKSVKLSIDTPSDLKPADYPIRVGIGEAQYMLYVTISKSHAGESGLLQLTVNDMEGSTVKGAAISLFNGGSREPVDRVLTDSNGMIDAEVAPGVYTMQVEKSGYTRVERKEVRIKSGITTELKPITIKPLDYAAEVLVSTPDMATPVGKNLQYEVTLRNIGKSDDTFQFASSSLPEGWSVHFKDAAENSSELSHVTLKAGDQKELIVEVVPDTGTLAGIHNLSIMTSSSKNRYETNLTAEIQGGDLTSTPQDRQTAVTPPTIGSILNGGQGDFSVNLNPPANTSPGEYQIGVFASSDRVQKSDILRAMGYEQVPVILLGLIMLLFLGGGLWYISRGKRP